MTSPTRRPTMRDVAHVAGVSLATVSRVVNGSGRVRGDLSARVRDAVELLGYRQDLTARTLRRADRASATLGVIIEDIGNPFFSAVQRGVEDVARERGVLTLTGSSDDDAVRERTLAGTFAARGVDGLVIVPCGGDEAYLGHERDRGVALVFVDRPPRFVDADAVVADNAGGARAAVAHLASGGHRRIAFLGDRPAIHTAAERLRGYREALATAGLRFDPALVASELTTCAAAEAAVGALLDAPAPPTALFTDQILITHGAIRALRALGRADDVALVGFDDIPLGDLLEPPVSVVAQDPLESGRRAARLLFSRLDGHAGPSRLVVLPTRLIVRRSALLGVPA
jgi:LacI family transcriptional regulator